MKRPTEALIAEAVARSAAIEEVAIGRGILCDVATFVRRHVADAPALIVADERGYEAAGRAVEAALVRGGMSVRAKVVPAHPRPKPTVELGEAIAAEIGSAVPLAVGSGVINDLTKYAAFRRDTRYLCVATAASMDGYSSAGAPLSDAGFKKTIPTRAPLAILANLDVVAAAPAEMSGWGYGDLAGKVPAGGDWIVADALQVEPVDDVAWPLVQDNLADWLSEPDAVRRGEPSAIADLFAGLTLSGLAMEFHGTSRPASGADHQIAHMWEMEDHTHGGERVSHGACVAIGCLVTLELFDWLLTQDLTQLEPQRIVADAPSLADKTAEIAASLSPAVAERALKETTAKHPSASEHAARLAAVVDVWPRLRDRLAAHLCRAEAMRAKLLAAGAPTTASDIGVSQDHLVRTIRRARFIRARYTILDLLAETGLLDRALEETVARADAAA